MNKTRTKFTDEMFSIKDEMFNLREMASQLEIMQQSADFLMHGACVTNQNFDETSFERNLDGGSRSLYEKAKTKRVESRN